MRYNICMKVEWKDFVKYALNEPGGWAQSPAHAYFSYDRNGEWEGKDGHRYALVSPGIQVKTPPEYRSDRTTYMSAPSKSIIERRMKEEWDKDRGMISDPFADMRADNTSAIADAILHTGGRLRRGEFGEAFNGVLAAITDAASGYKANGGQKVSPYNMIPRPPKWTRPRHDSSRLAALGYLAERKGITPTRKMLVGNLRKTDPGLSDSEVIAAVPRWKLRRVLRNGDGDISGKTYRSHSAEGLYGAAERGYETWPSSYYHGKSKQLSPEFNGWSGDGGIPAYITSYTRNVEEIPSVMTTAWDMASPLSGEVARKLNNGYSRHDLLSGWLNGNHIWKPSRSSRYGVELRPGKLRTEWESKNPGKKMTLFDAYKIIADLVDDNPVERKFIDSVPFDANTIQAIWGYDPSRPSASSMADKLGVPYISGSAWRDLRTRVNLDEYRDTRRREHNVFRGDLDAFRRR